MTKVGFMVLFTTVGMQSAAFAEEVCMSPVQKIVRGSSMYDRNGSQMSVVCNYADGLALQQASDTCGGAMKTSSHVEYRDSWRSSYYDSCNSHVAFQCVVTCPVVTPVISEPFTDSDETLPR